jgi:hypothetical protein
MKCRTAVFGSFLLGLEWLSDNFGSFFSAMKCLMASIGFFLSGMTYRRKYGSNVAERVPAFGVPSCKLE